MGNVTMAENNTNKQKGFLSWSTLLLIVAVGFVLMVTLKLGPHYIDNYYISVALKSLAREYPQIDELSNSDIERELSNFATINNIRGQEARSFKIVRKRDKVIVNNIYEVRQPLILNVDVVLSFKSQLSSANPELCCGFYIEDEPEN